MRTILLRCFLVGLSLFPVFVVGAASAQQSGWGDARFRTLQADHLTGRTGRDYSVDPNERSSLRRIEPSAPTESHTYRYVIDIDGKQCRGFGRLFTLRRPGEETTAGVLPQAVSDEHLRRLGRQMVEHATHGANPESNSTTPAGYTFFAQFIDHDITFDTTSMLNVPIRDDELRNARTPNLDLDSVYGGGPEETPYLYQLPYLRIGRPVVRGASRVWHDLLRAPSGKASGPRGGEPRALIGDPRNDENFVLAQMHAAFIAFHNRIVDLLVERRHGKERSRHCRRWCGTRELAAALPQSTRKEIFEAARAHVIHYYHRVIVEDFLPRTIGTNRVRDLLARGRAFYFPKGFQESSGRVSMPFIPVEFSVAAFRFGHSQVRDSYWLREGVLRSLFSTEGAQEPGTGSLAFKPLRAELIVDWGFFFDIGPRPPRGFNFARKIDPQIARSLHNLGAFNIVARRELVSLPARNLSRGRTLRLPSGQAVAAKILPVLQARRVLQSAHQADQYGFQPRPGSWRAFLLPADLRTRAELGSDETPLFYYILQEAAALGEASGNGSPLAHLSGLRGRRTADRYAQSAAFLAPRSADRRLVYRDRIVDGDATHNRILGETLGPVGGTIVGEVLLGLVEHYQIETGRGLSYKPEIRAGVEPSNRAPFSLTVARGYPGSDRPRYMMRNLLIDAGVAGPVRQLHVDQTNCFGEVDNCVRDRSSSQFAPRESEAAPASRGRGIAADIDRGTRALANRATVLLAMDAGNRGIRRWQKSADPILCVGRRCYVSQGTSRDAVAMSRAKAFGPWVALGTRAGPCRRSLSCVFRNVDLGGAFAEVQPIDLRILRHDRREPRLVKADPTCQVKLGRLVCRNTVRASDYTLWVVPERIAAEAGGPALEAAIRSRIGAKRNAAMKSN